MKNLVLLVLLTFSMSAFADLVRPWPRVTVWSDSVEVSIQNFEPRNYRCSGTVWMNFSDGRSRSEFVSIFVFSRSNAYRRILNYNRNVTIRSAHHSITCF